MFNQIFHCIVHYTTIVLQGIKIHFNMDNSGIAHVSGAEILFERAPKEKSTFACKLMSDLPVFNFKNVSFFITQDLCEVC